MKRMHGIAVAAVIVGTSLGVHVARAQQSGIKRTDLQQHDLSIAGREVVQVRVDFSPGVAFGRHSHPGEEIVYVLEGSLEYGVDGKPPVTRGRSPATSSPATEQLSPLALAPQVARAQLRMKPSTSLAAHASVFSRALPLQ